MSPVQNQASEIQATDFEVVEEKPGLTHLEEGPELANADYTMIEIHDLLGCFSVQTGAQFE